MLVSSLEIQEAVTNKVMDLTSSDISDGFFLLKNFKSTSLINIQ